MTDDQVQVPVEEHAQASPDSSHVDASAVMSPREQAFDVLSAATVALVAVGNRHPTASEVRLEMKRRTYSGFNPKAMGYKRFRDFLADAEENGVIKIDHSRPGDITVSPSHSVSAVSDSTPSIRRDVWKAFVDWTPDRMRLYDLTTGRAIVIPSEPVPLEPEQFQKLRIQLAANPTNFVEIKPIDVRQQVDWMRHWVDKVPEREVRAFLESALASEKPVKAFNAVMRGLPESYSAGWKRAFQENVRAKIEEWLKETPDAERISIYREVDIDAADPPSAGTADDSTVEPKPSQQFSSNHLLGLDASSRGSLSNLWLMALRNRIGSTQASDADLLRSRVHAAIERMPIDEIRMLRIPIGYLFED